MSDAYDTIIIGAGLAGLSVGALLASEEGGNILILEKEE
ncbi:MAG: FAD-binding protein, partial [Deltaproteobacteria bacterium]|nr:FAD-binding protein [Deltaproteobacteria bacterium]